MNREQIIRMAREAGFTEGDISLFPDLIAHFAFLVAAVERNKLAAWMMRQGYATGHGDSTEDLLKELEWQICEKLEKGVSDERKSQHAPESQRSKERFVR